MKSRLVIIVISSIIYLSCINNAQKYVQLGEEFLQKRKYERAVMAFRTAIDVNPSLVDAYDGLAKAYQALGQISEAIASLEKALRINPENLEMKTRLAALYLSVSPPQLSETEKIINEILSTNPNYADAHILKANLLIKTGASEDEILKVFNYAIQLEPQRQESYFALARFLTQRQRYKEAEDILKRALNINEKAANAYLEYGVFLSTVSRIGEAEKMFEKSIDINPQFYQAYEVTANFYLSNGELNKAEQIYTKLIENLGSTAENLTDLARFYLKIGRENDAINIFEKILQQEPEYTVARYHLAEIYLMRGELEKARKETENLLAYDEKDSRALILRARTFLQENDPLQAIKDLDLALKIQPSSKAGIFYMIQAYLDLGQSEKAELYLGDLQKYYPDYPYSKLLRAQIETLRGNNERALQELTQLLEVSKSSIDQTQEIRDLRKKALSAQGLIFLEQRKFEEAEKKLLEAASLKPTLASDMTNLAKLQFLKKNFPEAIKLYEKALELDKMNLDALSGLINTLKFNKKFTQAHEKLQKAIDENTEIKLLPAFHVLKSQLFQAEGRISEASEELEKAIKINQNYLPTYIAYAEILTAQGRIDEALAKYQEVLQRRPSPGLYVLAGILEELRKNWQEAEKNYRKALEINPDNPIAANNLAWLIATQTQGNLDEALSLAQNAIEKIPNEPAFFDTLGMVYLKKGLYSQAIESFRRAILLDETKSKSSTDNLNPTYRLRLAHALIQIGDKTQAKKELELTIKMERFLKPEDLYQAKNLLRSL
ncbi:MAG: tetratricopeptide repeat protein [Acidobacteria bacterium]|nr:MAG: tetratricopeptide repeat protein [Acidobacteriota bacterium]